MTDNIKPIAEWNFFQESDASFNDKNVLISGEKIITTYKTLIDIAIFTNKRLIVKNRNGISDENAKLFSLPYSSIVMWSTRDCAGNSPLDIGTEVELWTKAGYIKIGLTKDIDIFKFERLLAEGIL